MPKGEPPAQPNNEQGKFLENKVAIVSFTCNRCNHARTITAKKYTPVSVIVTDVKYHTEDVGKKVYEVEMQPFPKNQQELADYMLQAHAQFVHGATEYDISDLRN